MTYPSGLENFLTLRNYVHPVQVGVSNDAFTVTLGGDGKTYSTETIGWEEWDRLIAWVAWRRIEIRPHSNGHETV